MVFANSSTASLLIINQSNRLVYVMWFGRSFESREMVTVRLFPFESQEGSQGFLSWRVSNKIWVKNRIQLLKLVLLHCNKILHRSWNFLRKLGFSLSSSSKNNMPSLFHCRYGNCKYQLWLLKCCKNRNFYYIFYIYVI